MHHSSFRAFDEEKFAAAFGLGGQRSGAFRSISADYFPFPPINSRFSPIIRRWSGSRPKSHHFGVGNEHL
jgi:hypothetical protein